MRSLMLLALALVPFLTCSCAADYTIQLQNDTNANLVPYPVVTFPPPPHRAAAPAEVLVGGASQPLVPTSFNPLYYSEIRKISVMLQFGLDVDPAQILVRTMNHQVPPGQEGNDPALQPTLIDQMLFEPTSKNLVFVVAAGAGFPVTMLEK